MNKCLILTAIYLLLRIQLLCSLCFSFLNQMSQMCFDNVKSVVDDIAKENNIAEYHVNVKEEKFTGDNYCSKIFRAQIVEDVGEKRHINLLIKLLIISQDMRDKIKGDSELKFTELEYIAYTSVLPALDKFQSDHNLPKDKCYIHPKFYKGGVEDMREFIILEDASYDGFEMYNKLKSFDYDHARVVLTDLARYHAVSFAMAEKDPNQFKSLYQQLYQDHSFAHMLETLVKNSTNKVLLQLKNVHKANIISKFLKGCGKKVETCYNSKLTYPYNVICHGDFHMNNMLFKYKAKTPEVLFIDWQLIRYASPVIDIMQIIFMSSDKDFRDKHYKQVCDEYYRTLGENLNLYGCDINKVYPRKVFDDNLIDLLPHGLVFGILGCVVFFRKPGEEKDMDQLFDEESTDNITATDEMVKRLEGFADDIVAYEKTIKEIK